MKGLDLDFSKQMLALTLVEKRGGANGGFRNEPRARSQKLSNQQI